MPIEITQNNLLLVEGKEDQLFFDALIRHQNLQNIQIISYEGTPNLRPFLKGVLVKSPGFRDRVKSLGIVRDADTNASSTFQSICDALQNAGLSVPNRVLEPAGHNPQITIMVIPHESPYGMLEDLCLKAVIDDPSINCMEQYFQCLQQLSSSTPNNISKAKVQVFLASRHEPGKRLGEAAQAGYWPWDNGVFETAKSFLQQIVS